MTEQSAKQLAEQYLITVQEDRQNSVGSNTEWTSIDPVDNWDLENTFNRFNIRGRLHEAYSSNSPKVRTALALACFAIAAVGFSIFNEKIGLPIRLFFTPWS